MARLSLRRGHLLRQRRSRLRMQLMMYGCRAVPSSRRSMASFSRCRPHARRSLSILAWQNGVLRMQLSGAASMHFTPALSHQPEATTLQASIALLSLCSTHARHLLRRLGMDGSGEWVPQHARAPMAILGWTRLS